MKYQERRYRSKVASGKMVSFNVVVQETDLHIRALAPLSEVARNLVIEHRGYLENHIRQHPLFAETLHPWHSKAPTPRIITDMIDAGAAAGVGPMAAVAGAMAEQVGRGLLAHSREVIVENGGDIFLKLDGPATIGVYAGASPLSMRVGLALQRRVAPFAVCTSSGSVGHSLSQGTADAVCVVAESCALADATATAIGNRVCSETDINRAITFGRSISAIEGIVIIKGDKLGAWGDLEVVPVGKP